MADQLGLHTVASTWYEAFMNGGYGSCKMDGTYRSKREVESAIKAANIRQKEAGYKPDEYYIMLCNSVCVYDSVGNVVSETVTRARV